MVVLLPHPDGPTNAPYWPGLISIFKPLNTFTCGLVGYRKCTSVNLMFPSTFSILFPVGDHESIDGVLSNREIIVAAEDFAFTMSGAKAKTCPADIDPKTIAINTESKILF